LQNIRTVLYCRDHHPSICNRYLSRYIEHFSCFCAHPCSDLLYVHTYYIFFIYLLIFSFWLYKVCSSLCSAFFSSRLSSLRFTSYIKLTVNPTAQTKVNVISVHKLRRDKTIFCRLWFTDKQNLEVFWCCYSTVDPETHIYHKKNFIFMRLQDIRHRLLLF
jgi:hypothetical protein